MDIARRATKHLAFPLWELPQLCILTLYVWKNWRVSRRLLPSSLSDFAACSGERIAQQVTRFIDGETISRRSRSSTHSVLTKSSTSRDSLRRDGSIWSNQLDWSIGLLYFNCHGCVRVKLFLHQDASTFTLETSNLHRVTSNRLRIEISRAHYYRYTRFYPTEILLNKAKYNTKI